MKTKTIEERAKEWGEHIAERAPYDVVDGKVCVFDIDMNIPYVAKESYIAGATEQKVIDDAVRLKKCDDMTKAEYNRETAFVDWYLKNGKGTPTYSDAIEWARKDLLDKACNAFCHTGCPHKIDSYNCLNNKCDTWKIFRKIMEE